MIQCIVCLVITFSRLGINNPASSLKSEVKELYLSLSLSLNPYETSSFLIVHLIMEKIAFTHLLPLMVRHFQQCHALSQVPSTKYKI